ncbi:unnamed protein product [Nezara viridula]|uniref:Uncharacterized protein n=1 Tax=Nezara viridula TaxID=85310 RepID=A0A9P0E8T7_NEZVI|nr:unnamed protein product [Nezara viridula]
MMPSPPANNRPEDERDSRGRDSHLGFCRYDLVSPGSCLSSPGQGYHKEEQIIKFQLGEIPVSKLNGFCSDGKVTIESLEEGIMKPKTAKVSFNWMKRFEEKAMGLLKQFKVGQWISANSSSGQNNWPLSSHRLLLGYLVFCRIS